MEVRIGVQHAQREITIDTTLETDEVEKAVVEALKEGGVFSLTDHKGRRVVVPGDRLAYVDIATGTAGTVGFRS